MKSGEFFQFRNTICLATHECKTEIKESDTEIINPIFEKIKEEYPEAYKTLCKIHKASKANSMFFKYLAVTRFIRCNFGVIDNIDDIDRFGQFHFEHVACPLRGICAYENVICNPRRHSRLTLAETQALKLLYAGYSRSEIADRLCLSIHTVENQIYNGYAKLGVRTTPDFIRYVNSHNIFPYEIL